MKLPELATRKTRNLLKMKLWVLRRNWYNLRMIKSDSESVHVRKNEIKLKGAYLFASKSDLLELNYATAI
jgi:hypothetical protein